MMIKLCESGDPVFRSTSPLSRGVLKSKGGGELSMHYCADPGTIETVFRTIISAYQLSICGAVSDLCEEYKACHVRKGRLVLAGQSDPSFVPTSSLEKTPTPSTDDPAQEDQLQKYQERVAKRKSFDPKGWIRGNTKIGPVLEVTTSYLQGKYVVEIRLESVNKDNSHSWVRISLSSSKLVTDLSNNKEDDNNEQETSEMQFEDFALKTNVLAFASRSKAKAKPRRRISASSSTRTLPIGERTWTDIEPEDYSPIAYPVSKQLST